MGAPWGHQEPSRRPLTCTNSVSEGGLEPSAPPVLVERESSPNRGLACGVRENERPNANRSGPLQRIGATTGGTDDLDPAQVRRAAHGRRFGVVDDEEEQS